MSKSKMSPILKIGIGFIAIAFLAGAYGLIYSIATSEQAGVGAGIAILAVRFLFMAVLGFIAVSFIKKLFSKPKKDTPPDSDSSDSPKSA